MILFLFWLEHKIIKIFRKIYLRVFLDSIILINLKATFKNLSSITIESSGVYSQVSKMNKMKPHSEQFQRALTIAYLYLR